MDSNNLKPSAIRRWIFERSLPRGGAANKLIGLAARGANRLLPPGIMSMRIGGRDVLVPSDHGLPRYQRSHPYYDTALPRVAAALQAAAAGGEVVIADIGANVGDTAIALLEVPGTFVIAIDGNETFTPFLRHNLRDLGDRTSIVEKFVGPPELGAFEVSSQRGTAHLTLADTPPAAGASQIASLSDILTTSGKAKLDLVKIDTDGFDIAIIRDTRDFLTASGSALFFEFDPGFFLKITPDGWAIFDELAAMGYVGGVVYLNTGSYLRSFRFADGNLADDLRCSLASLPQASYFDVLLFKRDDQLAHFVARELAYFAGR